MDGNFYTTPFRVCGKSKYENSSIAENLSANENKSFLKSDRVIDNRYNIDSGEFSSPKGEEASPSSLKELEEIQEWKLSMLDENNYTYIEDDVIKILSSGRLFRVVSDKAV